MVKECKTTDLGKEYMGHVASTLSGKICQRWDSQSPHTHTKDESKLPDQTLSDAANFCRNPDGEIHGPWCYTIDNATRWEYCNVPTCSGKYMELFRQAVL